MVTMSHISNTSRANDPKMDPDCAICASAATVECGCEAAALDKALRQAETHMMSTFFEEVRLWVRQHAQDYVLKYFDLLRARREAHYHSHIAHLAAQAAYYRQHPHPAEISLAEAELKRGIDEDWRASVQRYPEVLEYYYSLVNFALPSSEDQAVSDPPLSALAGARKAGGRVRIMAPAATRVMEVLPGLQGLGMGAPRGDRGGRRRERDIRRSGLEYAYPGPGY